MHATDELNGFIRMCDRLPGNNPYRWPILRQS